MNAHPLTIPQSAVTSPREDHLAIPAPARGSLAHLFCDDHDYGDEEFLPALMCACLNSHALPLYGLFGQSDFFSADREVADAVAHARTMDDVEAAIDRYWTHPTNRFWLRRAGGVRLSTLRLRQFASDYLPAIKPRPAARLSQSTR